MFSEGRHRSLAISEPLGILVSFLQLPRQVWKQLLKYLLLLEHSVRTGIRLWRNINSRIIAVVSVLFCHQPRWILKHYQKFDLLCSAFNLACFGVWLQGLRLSRFWKRSWKISVFTCEQSPEYKHNMIRVNKDSDKHVMSCGGDVQQTVPFRS